MKTDTLKPRQRAMLAALADTGNVTLAAKAARVSRTQHYAWLTASAAYSAAVTDAMDQAADLLEGEARRRAFDGVDEPIVYQGQITKKTDTLGRGTRYAQTIKRYSDVLLIFLLKGLRPQKFRDNASLEIDVSDKLIERLAAGRARVAKRDGDNAG